MIERILERMLTFSFVIIGVWIMTTFVIFLLQTVKKILDKRRDKKG